MTIFPRRGSIAQLERHRGHGRRSATTNSGSGSIVNDLVNMPAGSTITVTYNTVVSNAFAGLLTNTATIATPAGVNDSNPANNTAVDQDAVGGVADLSITKVDNMGGSSINSSTGTVIAGTTFQYTIVVTNNGPIAPSVERPSQIISRRRSLATPGLPPRPAEQPVLLSVVQATSMTQSRCR